MIKINYKISGLTCEACLKLTKKRLEKISDVTEVNVNISGETQITALRPIEKTEIIEALKGTNYQLI